jgi:hypothetical protein
LAVGLDYYLQLSLGYTYKHIYFDGGPGIQVGPVVNDDYQSSSAYDLGLILTIPCADLYNKAAATELKWFGTIVPAFNISLGTTMLNIGDTMEFWGFSSRLPRQAKIGYGLSLELTGALRSQAIRFLRFDWACEAEDILTDLSRSDAEYRSYPGNIKFWNNVILGKTDGEVIINNGLSLALFEFLEFRWGRRNLPGDDLFYNYTSSGFTVSSKGPLLLLADYAKTDMINWIAAHLELKYSSSKYRSDALFMIDRFDGLFLNVTIFQQANTHF